MKIKVPSAIGIVALLGAAFWMRQIASWRPQVVARLGMTNTMTELSRDGRRMLVLGMVNKPGIYTETVILDLESAGSDARITSDPRRIRDFWKGNRVEPHLSLNPRQTQFIFSPPHGKSVLLEGKIHPEDSDFDASGGGPSNFAWSPSRGEIYREDNCEIRIWDWQTGELKNRHFHWKDGSPQIGTFSPDGQSLLSYNRSRQGIYTLIRYDVPSGRPTATIHRAVDCYARDFGWSPDGKYLWFVRQDLKGNHIDFNVLRASDSKPGWRAPCSGESRWLPDGRIGLMQQGGFSFRDALGRETCHLSGPTRGTQDWQATPDGKWIYDTDRTGTIHRWRAK